MNQHTIYCTKEQTERAYKLGAPIYEYFEEGTHYPHLERPTAEQMCGWLREKGMFVEVCYSLYRKPFLAVVNTMSDGDEINHYDPKDIYEQAIHAAIDAALEYLESNK